VRRRSAPERRRARRCAVPACAALRAYEAAGFLRIRTLRPTVVCHDPALRAEVAAVAGGWHFSKADHDWDQVHPVP